eukprot:1442734-Prymnesium_polylepis.2
MPPGHTDRGVDRQRMTERLNAARRQADDDREADRGAQEHYGRPHRSDSSGQQEIDASRKIHLRGRTRPFRFRSNLPLGSIWGNVRFHCAPVPGMVLQCMADGR